MKLTVEKDVLRDALKIVGLAISSSVSEEQWKHVLVRREPGSEIVEIVAQSGRLFSRVPLKCTVEGDFQPFTFNAVKLTGWLEQVSGDEPLEMIYNAEDAVTRIVSKDTKGKSHPPFKSLDTGAYFDWKDMVDKTDLTMTIEAKRLKEALGFAKAFISADETKTPEFCVTELVNGALLATDKRVAVRVKLAGAEKSNLRLQGKDVSSMEKFLDLCGDGKVDVLEQDRYAIFRRQDGSLLGEAKPTKKFPAINPGAGGDGHWWIVSKGALQDAVSWLTPLSDKADPRLSIRKEGDSVVIGKADLETKELLTREIPCLNSGVSEKYPALPEAGVVIDSEALLKILPRIGDDNIKLELYPRERGGWVRIEEIRDQDEFLSMLVWLS
jgi:hypothetical protein